MQESPNRAARIRVLVADDTRIHTELLAGTLKDDPNLVVGVWHSASDRLGAPSGPHDFDVLLISSQLQEEPRRGFDVLRGVRAANPEVRAVVLLGSLRDTLVLEAFRAGAQGVFSKQESVDTLGKCIRCVHQGQIWASNREMSLAIAALASSPQVRAVDAGGFHLLSPREMEVIRCLAEGLSNREIAGRLGLSQHTVKNYLFKVFDKLGVSTRVELLSMTLNQNNNGSVLQRVLSDSTSHVVRDEADVPECQKAAENGSMLATFALAQWYGSRKSSAQDLVRSYMWYVVASERLTRALQNVGETMTPTQIQDAEQKAAVLRSKSRKIAPSLERFAADSLPPSAAAD